MAAAALLIAAPLSAEVRQPVGQAQRLSTIPLAIQTARGSVRYRVEVARTSREQATGMMYRLRVPPHTGMLFPMIPPRRASFWMMNTFVSLDLVFIRADRTISSIAADATPRSLTPIESDEPVVAVLELKGGEAARRGIRPGDRVRW
jgi:uncharacterized protein